MDNQAALGYGIQEQGPTSKAAPKSGAVQKKKPDIRPTHDQLYIAGKLGLSIAAVQRLNTRYGVRTASDAMRMLHGFPPQDELKSAFAYIETICREAM